jgi:hypothetical protein
MSFDQKKVVSSLRIGVQFIFLVFTSSLLINFAFLLCFDLFPLMTSTEAQLPPYVGGL